MYIYIYRERERKRERKRRRREENLGCGNTDTMPAERMATRPDACGCGVQGLVRYVCTPTEAVSEPEIAPPAHRVGSNRL